MDAELQTLRRKGGAQVAQLQEISKLISRIDTKSMSNQHVGNSCSSGSSSSRSKLSKDVISERLDEVVTIFNEVDRAALRLEQLTEQRRERLREIARQRTLEDEMNEVNIYLFVIFIFSIKINNFFGDDCK